MYRIITNNQMCLVKQGDQIQVEYLDGQSYMDVLVKVRDYIQNGWCLETHPMTGSLKPNQTPYKSVMVSDRPVDKEEFYQQEIRKTPDWPQNLLEDFQAVDLSLIEGAIQKILQFLRKRGKRKQ